MFGPPSNWCICPLLLQSMSPAGSALGPCGGLRATDFMAHRAEGSQKLGEWGVIADKYHWVGVLRLVRVVSHNICPRSGSKLGRAVK